MPEPDVHFVIDSDALPEGGKRVEALIQHAIFTAGAADDVPLQDVVDDFVLAAAVTMILVHKTMPEAPLCPPMRGREKLDAALQAVSELAESMLGRTEGGADG